MEDILGYDSGKARDTVTKYAKTQNHRFGVLCWTPVNKRVNEIFELYDLLKEQNENSYFGHLNSIN